MTTTRHLNERTKIEQVFNFNKARLSCKVFNWYKGDEENQDKTKLQRLGDTLQPEVEIIVLIVVIVLFIKMIS